MENTSDNLADFQAFHPLSWRTIIPGRVSVITATFNAAANLARCIESVASQDYHDIEHIVIDGGSTDGTVGVIKRNEYRLRYWISERDTGVYDAWNKGVMAASGEWIAFLGADDVYLPGAIRAYMDNVRSRVIDYISSFVRWIPSPPEKPKIVGQCWNWPAFQREMTTAHVGSMHHYSLYRKFGIYDTSYRITGDYELLLRPRSMLRSAFLAMVTAEMLGGGVSDTFAALKEAERCKTLSGGRSRSLARIELSIKQCKLLARRASVFLNL